MLLKRGRKFGLKKLNKKGQIMNKKDLETVEELYGKAFDEAKD